MDRSSYPNVPVVVNIEDPQWPSKELFYNVLDWIVWYYKVNKDVLNSNGEHLSDEQIKEILDKFAEDYVLDIMDGKECERCPTRFELSLKALYDAGYPLNMLYFFVPTYTEMIVNGDWVID